MAGNAAIFSSGPTDRLSGFETDTHGLEERGDLVKGEPSGDGVSSLRSILRTSGTVAPPALMCTSADAHARHDSHTAKVRSATQSVCRRTRQRARSSGARPRSGTPRRSIGDVSCANYEWIFPFSGAARGLRRRAARGSWIVSRQCERRAEEARASLHARSVEGETTDDERRRHSHARRPRFMTHARTSRQEKHSCFVFCDEEKSGVGRAEGRSVAGDAGTHLCPRRVATFSARPS